MQKKRLLQVVGAASGALLLTTVLKKRAAAGKSAPKAGVDASPTEVWVNTERRIYHLPGTRWYGKTANGEYMTEKAARAAGCKPASRSAPPTSKRAARK